jgi:hypothetical protein
MAACLARPIICASVCPLFYILGAVPDLSQQGIARAAWTLPRLELGRVVELPKVGGLHHHAPPERTTKHP